jgi:hypothetical protein
VESNLRFGGLRPVGPTESHLVNFDVLSWRFRAFCQGSLNRQRPSASPLPLGKSALLGSLEYIQALPLRLI